MKEQVLLAIVCAAGPLIIAATAILLNRWGLALFHRPLRRTMPKHGESALSCTDTKRPPPQDKQP
jgi:hypothetical protein